MSIAGLKLTFPSRTRSIRSLATMVLHIRVWESSSMPGFFLLFFQTFFITLMRRFRSIRERSWNKAVLYNFLFYWNFEITSVVFLNSCFYCIFFPVSIAGLKLTFPSRTRSIRSLATMVLHIRVWESSSMPGFFLYFYWIFVFLFSIEKLETMLLHVRV